MTASRSQSAHPGQSNPVCSSQPTIAARPYHLQNLTIPHAGRETTQGHPARGPPQIYVKVVTLMSKFQDRGHCNDLCYNPAMTGKASNQASWWMMIASSSGIF